MSHGGKLSAFNSLHSSKTTPAVLDCDGGKPGRTQIELEEEKGQHQEEKKPGSHYLTLMRDRGRAMNGHRALTQDHLFHAGLVSRKH